MCIVAFLYSLHFLVWMTIKHKHGAVLDFWQRVLRLGSPSFVNSAYVLSDFVYMWLVLGVHDGRAHNKKKVKMETRKTNRPCLPVWMTPSLPPQPLSKQIDLISKSRGPLSLFGIVSFEHGFAFWREMLRTRWQLMDQDFYFEFWGLLGWTPS